MSTENTNPSPAATPAPMTLPQPFIIHHRDSYFGRFGKYLLIALGLCVVAMIGMSAAYQEYLGDGTGPQEKYHSLSKLATNKVAIVQVSGAIMETDDFVKQQIDQIEKDESVKAIVLRINSPGGTVTYSDYLLHHLKQLREEREIPLVVSMGSICASGGYYMAMAVGDTENAIYAEPATWTGSIGVIIPHYDLSAFSNSAFLPGIKDDSIVSGKHKQMGSMLKKMSDEDRALFQELVDLAYEGFLDKVKSGRPQLAETPDKLAELTQGQIFTASQALEGGLVDKIGFIEDAVDRAITLANLDKDSTRVVTYKRQLTPIDAFLGADAKPQPAATMNPLQSMIELSTPRAYYLFSGLPAVLQSN